MANPEDIGRPLLRNPAAREGAKDALGVPGAVLAAGFIGFGAVAADNQLPLAAAVASTLAIWALPGQLVLAEMFHAGAAPLAIVLAVMLINARFLPMTVSLMPLLHGPDSTPRRLYLAAHLVAMTGWAVAMRRCPELPPADRLAYYVGFALACWAVSLVCTVAGFYFASALPPLLKLAFVFLNPLYFLLLLVGETRERAWFVAMAAGALAGPAFHLLDPKWSVLVTGLAGGTIAFALLRAAGRGHD